MLNCSERMPGFKDFANSGPSRCTFYEWIFQFLFCLSWFIFLGMNVDRWFAIKFPEAYQKSLKTHHTWFIVGAWWLLALIPDLPLWFVPNFSSYSFSPFSWFGPFFSFSFFLWFDQYVERGMKDHGCHCFVPIQNEVWMWFKTATCFVIPSLIITMIWVSLAHTLRT